MKFVKLMLILTVTAVFIIACNQHETTENAAVTNTNTVANITPEANVPTDELALGRKHYQEQCARCHKEDGTGGKVVIEGRKMKPHNLTSDHMKKDADSEYIEVMEKGIPDEGMPSFKKELSEDDMKAVVKYIREELQK